MRGLARFSSVRARPCPRRMRHGFAGRPPASDAGGEAPEPIVGGLLGTDLRQVLWRGALLLNPGAARDVRFRFTCAVQGIHRPHGLPGLVPCTCVWLSMATATPSLQYIAAIVRCVSFARTLRPVVAVLSPSVRSGVQLTRLSRFVPWARRAAIRRRHAGMSTECGWLWLDVCSAPGGRRAFRWRPRGEGNGSIEAVCKAEGLGFLCFSLRWSVAAPESGGWMAGIQCRTSPWRHGSGAERRSGSELGASAAFRDAAV